MTQLTRAESIQIEGRIARERHNLYLAQKCDRGKTSSCSTSRRPQVSRHVALQRNCYFSKILELPEVAKRIDLLFVLNFHSEKSRSEGQDWRQPRS